MLFCNQTHLSPDPTPATPGPLSLIPNNHKSPFCSHKVSTCSAFQQFCRFKILHNRIIQYLNFRVAFFTLEMQPSVVYINSFFLFLELWGRHSFFDHSAIEGQLAYFQFGAIMSKAAMNNCAQFFM